MIFGIGLWLAVELIMAIATMVVVVAMEWPFRALVWAIVIGTAIAWLNGIDVFGWIAAHPGNVLGGLAAWIFIGGASSLFFWQRYINSDAVTTQVSIARSVWVRNGSAGQFVDSDEFASIFNLRNDMWRIANWVIWWPFKWVSYLLGSFFVDMVQWIAKNVSGLYAHMAKNRYRG